MKFNKVRSEVSRHGVRILLSPLEFDMLKMISNAKYGMSPKRISDNQYQLDPNGGPEMGHRVVHQRRCHLNRKIKPLGIAVMAHKRGAGGVYELYELDESKSS